MKTTRIWKTALVTAVAAALVLTGCAGGGGEPAEPTDTLRANWGQYPESWEPGSQAIEYGYIFVPYETLVQRQPDGTILPQLATEWEFGERSMSLSLTLRDDVVFHDGEPFNAEAVKANIEYVKDVVGGQFGGPIKAGVESIEVTGDYTLTINFTRPYSTFLALLSQRNVTYASPVALADGTVKTQPVGTGPWIYDQETSEPGTVAKFTAFEDYWGEIPAIANIELYGIQDHASAAAALVNGELDVADIEAENLPLIEGQDGIESYSYPAVRNNITFFDRAEGGVFADPLVRQALCSALDVDAFVALDETGSAANQHFIEGEYGYSDSIAGYPHDLEKAEELLAEAGNPTIDVTIPLTAFNKGQVEVYAEQMNQLPGVTVTTQELPAPQYISTWNSGQFPFGIGNNPQITPADWYGAWFSPTAGGNPAKVASEELTGLVGKAQGLGGAPEAEEAWVDVLTQIDEEALACGFAVNEQIIAYRSDVLSDVGPSIQPFEVNLINYKAVKPVG